MKLLTQTNWDATLSVTACAQDFPNMKFKLVKQVNSCLENKYVWKGDQNESPKIEIVGAELMV